MRILLWVLGLLNIANGGWMLFGPEAWYHELPAGVPDTGPLNHHFVRDIGAAFVTFGVMLCVAAESPKVGRFAVAMVALFLGLHAAIHVFDLLTGRLDFDHWLIDMPGVFVPALLAGILCMPRWWQKASTGGGY